MRRRAVCLYVNRSRAWLAGGAHLEMLPEVNITSNECLHKLVGQVKLRAQSATSKIGSKYRLAPLAGLNATGGSKQQFYVVLGKDGEQDQITETPEFVQDGAGMYICTNESSRGSVPTISTSPIKEEDVITVHLTGDVNGQP